MLASDIFVEHGSSGTDSLLNRDNGEVVCDLGNVALSKIDSESKKRRVIFDLRTVTDNIFRNRSRSPGQRRRLRACGEEYLFLFDL